MNKIYLLLFLVSIFIASLSQILLKKGATHKNIYINKHTLIGYGLMGFSTLFTLIGYRGVSLSASQMLQSLSFVFVSILSYIFLNEKISKRNIIGLLFIIIGIIIYSI